MLMQVMRCFNYYSTPQQFMKTIHGPSLKVPSLLDVQAQMHTMFNTFFAAECGALLELMIGVVGVPEGLDDEDLLE